MTTNVLLVIVAMVALFLLCILIAIIWIAVAVVWPYVKAQYELTRVYRQREQEQFIATLKDQARGNDVTRRLLEQMIEGFSLHTKAVHGQTNSIQRLADGLTSVQRRKAVPKPPKDITE